MTTGERVAEPQMSDEAIANGTGRGWDAWVTVLDAWGAAGQGHTAIARHVHEAHGIDGWWAQAVTVGYERIRGLRAVNERPDGYAMNASRTVAAPVGELFALFVDDAKRDEWLGEGVLRVRTASEPRSARFDVLDEGGGILAAWFTDKGERSTVQLQLDRIPDEAALAERKALWKTRLDALTKHVRHGD
jgi:hypothetical protein